MASPFVTFLGSDLIRNKRMLRFTEKTNKIII